jgi:hypothetical protein
VHDIDTALDTLRARDAAAARLARGLWAALRFGAAHPENVTRYDVQQICWTALPRLPGDPAGAAHVLADLLDLLGYPRYAEICRGPTTNAILAADADIRPALVRAAWRESGIEPPNTPALAWGAARGPVEQAVHAGVGRILEEAGDNGFFDAEDADQLRVGLTMKVLASPADGQPGAWHLQIFNERLASWLTAGGSQTRREMLVRVKPDLGRVPQFDPCYEFPALQALLEACRGDGVGLTRSGYLPTALVRELVELMPACADIETSGRGEKSWPPVSSLRYVATELELIQKIGHRLVLTAAGQDRVDDPDTLAMALGEDMIAKDTSIRGVIQEVCLAALLLEDVIELDRLLDKVAAVVDEEGWGTGWRGPPVDELSRDYGWLFLQRLYILDVLRPDDTSTRVGLTEAGRAAARWGLRARVMLREVPG